MDARVKDMDPILHCEDWVERIGGISLFPSISGLFPRGGRWPSSSDEVFLGVIASLRIEVGVNEG
jgi:hypothetical protein